MLFENPFASPLFVPTVVRWAILFGASLAALLFLYWRSRDPVLLVRWRTWLYIAPIYLFGVLGGVLTTTALVMWLTFQGLREYARLVDLAPAYRRILLAMGLAVAPVAALSAEGAYLLAPMLLIVATLQPLLFGRIAGGVRQLAFAAFGWGYIGWFLGHLVLMREHLLGGAGILLAMGLAVALSDVGAFVVGKIFGRHKLTPRLSPNKTVEGVVGNFLGAYFGLIVMSFAIPSALRPFVVLGLPLLVGLGALWGDLVESAIKREFGVKDAGTWLPGFGGILDRIDSLLIVAPLAYYVLKMAA
jgi:phosphatidate cytidylyltransferase